MTRGQILVVDDQQDMRDLVTATMEAEGYAVKVAANAMEAFEQLGSETFDLIVLDVMMPTITGLEVLDHIRRTDSTPVILLTSLGAEENKVRGLRLGADDYLTKPFSPKELAARVEAILRRTGAAAHAAEQLEFGALRIDLRSRRVHVGSTEVDMTAKEFDLLTFLASRPGRVFTRHQLLRDVWGSSSEFQQEGTITEHVRRIRAKVGADDVGTIETVRGVGYRFDPPRRGARSDG